MTMSLYIGGFEQFDKDLNSLLIPKTVIRRCKLMKERQCYDEQKSEKDEQWSMKHNIEY